MDHSVADMLARHYRRLHDQILVLIDDHTDDQLAWHPAPAVRSIAWNIGHVVRCTRRLRESLPSMATVLADAPLPAHRDTMAGTTARAHPPELGKEMLLEGARQAFADVERLITAVDASRRPAHQRADEIGEALVDHLAHAHRHLGQIELLRSLQGLGRVPAR